MLATKMSAQGSLSHEIDGNGLLEKMLIKTGAKLLHNQERIAGNSESCRALPSLSLRKKILAPDRSCIFNLAFKFQESGRPDSQVDTTTPRV